MKITEDVRPARCGTAEQGIAEEEALKKGMEEKSIRMWRRPKFCRAILVAAFTCGVITAQTQERDNPKFSNQAESTAKNLSQQIRQEISQPGKHEWAGDYYEGDGTGENVSLLIAPKHGYVFEWHGCLGLYDRNYGDVTVTNGRLQLSFTFTNKHEGFEGIAAEFIPVRWGKRMYLVPTKEIVRFCNEVNSGLEPRKEPHGRQLLRHGDEKRLATGDPAIPVEYRAYLLKEPIKAEITKIAKVVTRPSKSDFKFKDTTVTINSGMSQGLRQGMEFYVNDPHDLVQTVEIVSVTDSESQGVITQIGEDNPPPKVGWKLSTRAPWRCPDESNPAK